MHASKGWITPKGSKYKQQYPKIPSTSGEESKKSNPSGEGKAKKEYTHVPYSQKLVLEKIIDLSFQDLQWKDGP